VHEFLKHFSGLRHLDLRTFNLGFLPEAIDQSPRLSELILSDCAITLTAESLMKLSALDQLTTLDLYKNPLGLMPRLERMPRLDYVDVSATGISEFPTGLLNHPRIRTALLNDNRLEVLPTTLFELPVSITEGIDLGGNPITASDHERIKSHFARTRHDFGVLADQDDLLRVQTLYTQMDREQASEFVYLLPGTLADGKVEITRLENEYSALRDSLAAWTADVPAIHPISGQPFTPHQLSNEHLIRDEFRNRLEQCWRRESDPEDIDPPQAPIYELNLSAGITGELPELPADFAHVTHLYMRSRRGRTSGATRFLERFPNLRHLTIYEYQLGNIPEAIFRMADLTHLALSGCHITLTEQTALELAQMERLDLLDLSDNPLGRTPDISQMTDLTVLLLDSTDISELPHGLLQLKNLRVANLNDNAIAHIPSDILELPLEFAGKINLRDNPLDEESVQRLIAYFRRTNIDFGVIAVIDSAEMEVSTSEDSEVDE
jgi:Leucine-rich repeat (LRR) protein